MKRLFPTSLVMLLITASFGHVLAAALCPRSLGRDCCLAMTTQHHHDSFSGHENVAPHDTHMNGMAMGDVNMDAMSMEMDGMAMGEAVDAKSMDRMSMNETTLDNATVDSSVSFTLLNSTPADVVNSFDQPVEVCSHCLGHTGIVNAPVPFAGVSDPSGRDSGPIILPVAKFPVRLGINLAQVGLPREHAPPENSAPRYVLISVFLI